MAWLSFACLPTSITMTLKKRNSTLQNSYFHVHLQYTSTQSFLHVLCGSCSIIMLYLNQLFASARIDLDNSIIVKLQDDSSMRDVATDVANELQVTQNYVVQIRKKRLFDFWPSSGGRPQMLTNTHKKICIKVATLGGVDIAT